MGMFHDIKVGSAESDAVKARNAGLPIAVFRIMFPQTAADFSGKVPDVSEMLATIESVGYRLDKMSYDTDAKGRTCGYFVFRWALDLGLLGRR